MHPTTKGFIEVYIFKSFINPYPVNKHQGNQSKQLQTSNMWMDRNGVKIVSWAEKSLENINVKKFGCFCIFLNKNILQYIETKEI